MNRHQAERVRSYLRGRLQLAVNRLTDLVDGRTDLYYVRPFDAIAVEFEGTLPEIVDHFNVTIPADILGGPLDAREND